MTYRSYLLPQLREIKSGHSMTEILPGLYIGNLKDSKDAKLLDLHRITHVLSIHDDAKKLFKEKKYLLISASDSPRQDLLQYFPQCNDFIHAARLRGGHVLVHCLAGISRSVTVVAAYIISVTSLNHQEALQTIRAARNMANPNIGFQKQLLEFERTSLKKERRRLAEKFRPRSAISPRRPQQQQIQSPSRPQSTAASSPGQGPSPTSPRPSASSLPSSPVNIAGRLTIRMVTTTTPAEDNLTTNDEERCAFLLNQYRRLVSSGEICTGNCGKVGITCTSGVCRISERSYSMSFLRRSSSTSPGTKKLMSSTSSSGLVSSNNNDKRPWNLWSVDQEDQLRHIQQQPNYSPPSQRMMLPMNPSSGGTTNPLQDIRRSSMRLKVPSYDQETSFPTSNRPFQQAQPPPPPQTRPSLSACATPLHSPRFRAQRLISYDGIQPGSVRGASRSVFDSQSRKSQSLSQIEIPMWTNDNWH